MPDTEYTITGSQYRIVQRITPRGSYSVISTQESMYNKTPDYLQMQRQISDCIALYQTFAHSKPSPKHKNLSGMNPHPLPPLPTDEDSDKESEELSFKEVEQIWLQKIPTARCKEHNHTSSEHLLPIVPHDHTPLSSKSGKPLPQTKLSEDSTFPSTPPRSLAAYPQSPIHTPQCVAALKRREQPPPYIESDVVSLVSLQDGIHTHHHTQSRIEPVVDHISTTPERPPTPPPHTTPYRPYGMDTHEIADVDSGFPTLSHPKVSSNMHETQQNVQVPLWDFVTSIEVQQRELTENRADVQSVRNCTPGRRIDRDNLSSILHTYHSRNGSGREVTQQRHEVEHFMKEILDVYPDMTFDGTAGKGGRDCCFCCVVM